MYSLIEKTTGNVLAITKTVQELEDLIPLFFGRDLMIRYNK